MRGEMRDDLTSETVKGTALSLKSVDNIEGGDGLSLGVLGVGDGVTDDTFEESLENTTSFFVNHCDALVLKDDNVRDGHTG
jgi:hypothetical protein